MTLLLNVVVWVKPQQQGSKNQGAGGHMYDANKHLPQWRKDVLARIGQRAEPPFEGPVIAVVEFAYEPPKRGKPEHLGWPSKPPDLDKLQRAVGDVLKIGKVLKDDGQIVEWHTRKVYVGASNARLTSPGTWLRVYAAPPA